MFLNKKNKGFTLLELLVVMAIIAFVSAVAAPRIGSTLDNMRLRSSVRKCAAVLRYARSMAITTQEEYRVRFTLDSTEGEIDSYSFDKVSFEKRQADDFEESENEGDRKERTIIKKEKKINLKEKITLDWQPNAEADWSNSGDYEVIFYPRGFSSGGELLFSREYEGKRKYILSIDPITGRTKILEG